jgi:hypothetical protein
MPTLKEFGEATKSLPLVSGYKKMGDGINVMVEGEPIYVEYTPAKGFVRHDFTISCRSSSLKRSTAAALPMP